MIEILTPSASERLATTAAVRAEVPAAATLGDEELGPLLDRASATIADHCGRHFGLVTLRESFFLGGAAVPSLILRRRPIASITSVTVDGAQLTAGTDFIRDDDAGMLRRRSGDMLVYWQGAQLVVVTYQAGYALPEAAPRSLERACLLTVQSMLSARGRDPMLRSESVDGVASASYLDPRAGMEALPPQAAALLGPYRDFAA